jgi:hypothetical protein
LIHEFKEQPETILEKTMFIVYQQNITAFDNN